VRQQKNRLLTLPPHARNQVPQTQRLTHKCLPERNPNLVFPTNSRLEIRRPKTLDRASPNPQNPKLPFLPNASSGSCFTPCLLPPASPMKPSSTCDRRYAQVRLKPSKLIHKTPLLIVIQQQEILEDSHWLVRPPDQLQKKGPAPQLSV